MRHNPVPDSVILNDSVNIFILYMVKKKLRNNVDIELSLKQSLQNRDTGSPGTSSLTHL